MTAGRDEVIAEIAEKWVAWTHHGNSTKFAIERAVREALSRVGGREAEPADYPKCCACGKEIRTFTNTTMCMGTVGMMQQESWQFEMPSGRVACIGCKFPATKEG